MQQTMSNEIRACAAVVVAISAVSMWACATPSAPAAAQALAVSGTVFQRATTPSGTVPVEGVFVAEANSRRNATTDAKGFYRIEGLPVGSVALSASKSSYYVANAAFAISADTSKDIEIIAVID